MLLFTIVPTFSPKDGEHLHIKNHASKDGSAGRSSRPSELAVDVKTLYAKFRELSLENYF